MYSMSKKHAEIIEDQNGSFSIKEICVAAHHLEHLPREELVYKTHKLANVLCDTHENCATSGHMVLFHDRPMTMKTYCSHLFAGPQACVSRVKYVNSPRFARGRLIASHVDALHFTTLAARYETLVEEQILSMALRLGI